MSSVDKMQEQIIELQTRLAYQEDSLNQLNQVVTEQSVWIDQLRQQLRALAEKYEDLRDTQRHGGGIADNEPPPHY